jgi:3-hydroxybutyryl-CoA dehydratase
MNFSAGFEELTEGDRFTVARRAITETDVSLFAAVSGDRHPQHLDAEWAARSAFGERIAHGLLVLSVAAGMVPFDPQRISALRRVRDAVFKRPVRLGESIRVEGEIAAARPLDADTGLVEVKLRVLGRNDRLSARGVLEVIWRCSSVDGDPMPHIVDAEPIAGEVLL